MGFEVCGDDHPASVVLVADVNCGTLVQASASACTPTSRSRAVRHDGGLAIAAVASMNGGDDKSGGPGDFSPGLPQIRTCGFPASGSSS
jgi:hypothetical protein